MTFMVKTGAWTGPVCETRSKMRFCRSSLSSATGFLGWDGAMRPRIGRFFFFGGDFFSFFALGGLSSVVSISISLSASTPITISDTSHRLPDESASAGRLLTPIFNAICERWWSGLQWGRPNSVQG